MQDPGKDGKSRVLLVKDNLMIRQAVANAISDQSDMTMTVAVDNAFEAHAAAADGRIDVVLVGVVLKDGSGLELVRTFKSFYPPVKAVVLSMVEDVHVLIESIRAGADGFVIVNRASVEQLIHSIRAVTEGKFVYDSALCGNAIRELLLKESSDDVRQLVASCLTARECQVVELLSKGMTNKEIARNLGISVSTTKSHVSKVFKRLGICSRRELLPRMRDLAEGMHLAREVRFGVYGNGGHAPGE